MFAENSDNATITRVLRNLALIITLYFCVVQKYADYEFSGVNKLQII